MSVNRAPQKAKPGELALAGFEKTWESFLFSRIYYAPAS
jgi:hypothetical protein